MKSEITRSFKAKIFHFLLGGVYTLGLDAILSRLLIPSTYGKYAVVSSLLEGFEKIKSFNFVMVATTAHQKDEDILPQFYSLSLLLEIVFIISVLCYLAVFPNAKTTAVYIGLRLIISIFNSWVLILSVKPSRALATYRVLYIFIAIKYISGALGVLLALLKYDIYSLFAIDLSSGLLQIVILFWKFKYSFRFFMKWKDIVFYFRNTLTLWPIEWAPYLSMPLVYLYVNQHFGNEQLGYLTKSLILIYLPTQYILQNFQAIVLNSIVKMQRDKMDFQPFLKMYTDVIVSGVCLCCIIVIINRDILINLLWGKQWHKVSDIVAYTCMATIAIVIHTLANDIFLALRQFKILLIIRYVQPISMWAIFFLQPQKNFHSIIIAFTLGWICMSIAHLVLLKKFLRKITGSLWLLLIICTMIIFAFNQLPQNIEIRIIASFLSVCCYIWYFYTKKYSISWLMNQLKF